MDTRSCVHTYKISNNKQGRKEEIEIEKEERDGEKEEGEKGRGRE